MRRIKEKSTANEILHDLVSELHESCNGGGGVYTQSEIVRRIIESARDYHNLVIDKDYNVYDIEDAMNFYEWNFSN